MSYIKRSKRKGKVYLSEVETKRVNGKVVTRHICYLGKEADGKTVLSSSLSNKEGIKGRPLIQIGLGVTQEEGVPVFHKTFHGNIHDSRTLQDLLTPFRAFGLRGGLMIFDRGISSKKNQRDINRGFLGT